MDVILTAGGIPKPKEALYTFTKGGYKALLDIAGKPMIQWVLDALSGSKNVDHIIIVGLPDMANLSCTKPVHLVANRGSMLDNIFAGIEVIRGYDPEPDAAIVVSSDVPAITSEMVDWLAETVAESDHNFFYNVITRQMMETRYPHSRRTYLKLKDVELCGGDMNAFRFSVLEGKSSTWERLIGARKNPFQQASIIGFDTLFLILLHLATLNEIEALVCNRLKIHGKVVLCPYAEMGMDVDKPHQLEILRRDLAQKNQE
jgi:GTP:adenosylcobinamide-phosphate guanylyltransferase